MQVDICIFIIINVRLERQPFDMYMKNFVTIHCFCVICIQTIYFAFDSNMDLVLVINTVVCTVCYMPSST
jgi:hypothetical protein